MAGGVALQGEAADRGVVTARVVHKRISSRGRIVGTSLVEKERVDSGSGIAVARRVTVERGQPDGDVRAAGVFFHVTTECGVEFAVNVRGKRKCPKGCVQDADGIVYECIEASRGIIVAGGVAEEGVGTNGSVVVTQIAGQRLITDCGVQITAGVATRPATPTAVLLHASGIGEEALKPDRGVVDSAGETEESICSLSGILARIPSVRRRRDGASRRQKSCKSQYKG